MNVEQRWQVGYVASGDDDDLGTSVAHNLLKQECNAGIREGLVALGVKGSEGAVVIEEQRGLGSEADGLPKKLEGGFYFRRQFPAP
jgi:hypothetical protein